MERLFTNIDGIPSQAVNVAERNAKLDIVIEYCKNRISKATKYRHINFWTFVALELIEMKYPE